MFGTKKPLPSVPGVKISDLQYKKGSSQLREMEILGGRTAGNTYTWRVADKRGGAARAEDSKEGWDDWPRCGAVAGVAPAGRGN